jgi:hypothetical protein
MYKNFYKREVYHCQVSRAMDFRVLTSSLCVSFAVRHERVGSLMFQCFMSINIVTYKELRD